MTHADPELFVEHLEFALDLVQRGATIPEAVDWLKHNAPRGDGVEPGYIGCAIYLPARLRTQMKERNREIGKLRAEGLTYAKIAGRVYLTESAVGKICRKEDWKRGIK